MWNTIVRNIQIFCLLTTIVTLITCSPEGRRKIYRTLFDGVPAPETNVEVVADSLVSSDSTTGLSKKIEPEWNLHPPYQDKECDTCHNRSRGNLYIETQPALCYNCHDDFKETFAFLHGPVASGYCTKCHSPHKSQNQKLLHRKGQEICFYCHEPTTVFQNEAHDGIEEFLCTECHNPHGGEERFLFN